MLCKSTPVSWNGSINANQKQNSLTATDHYNSMFYKVIQLGKKHSFFQYLRKCKEES